MHLRPAIQRQQRVLGLHTLVEYLHIIKLRRIFQRDGRVKRKLGADAVNRR